MAEQTPDVRNSTIFLLLTTSGLGNSRKVSNKAQFVEPHGIDPKMVSMSHRLLDCSEFQEIGRHEGGFRDWLLSIDVSPRSLFKAGIYGLALAKVEEANRRLVQFVAEREALVDQLGTVYAARVQEAKARLGPQFDPADYLPHEDGRPEAIQALLRQEFRVTYQYLEFSTPTSLSGVSQTMFEAERARAQEMWEGITQQMETALFLEIQERLGKLLGTLSTGRLQQRSWDKIRTFLEEFSAWRNVTNNSQLQALVQRTRQLFDAVPDAGVIRQHTGVASAISEGISQLQEELNTLIDQQPQRVIRFQLGAESNGQATEEMPAVV